MITGNDLTYQSEEEKVIPCEDFSFNKGINYLSYQRKDIFSVLSFSFGSLATGSLAINGVSIQPSGFVGGTVKVIKLDVNHIGTLSLICAYKDGDPQADFHYQKLVNELKALKSPTTTVEEKKDKMALLKTVLSLNDIAYLLLDLNDPLTNDNRALWEQTLSDYPGCCFFLLNDLSKEVVKASPVDKSVSLSSKFCLPYRVGMGLTSLLSIFLCLFGRSEQIKGSSKGTLLIVLGLLFLAGNIVIGVFLSRKTIKEGFKRSALFSFEAWNAGFNVVGLAIALAAGWLFSEKMTTLSKGLFAGSSLAIITLVGISLILSAFLVGHISATRLLNVVKNTSKTLN
jgi:hypothetical protein